MENNEQTAEDYIEIADKIRSGEYFRDARAMYDIDVHSPMSDRYWFLFISFMSLIITVVAVVAWMGFFPLNNRVPFIFATNNIIDDYPRVKSLLNFNLLHKLWIDLTINLANCKSEQLQTSSSDTNVTTIHEVNCHKPQRISFKSRLTKTIHAI